MKMQTPAGMEHCADVFDGVYELPIAFDRPCKILDIGANVGAFALWASSRWEVGEVHCYEPFPTNFDALCVNTCHLPHVTRYNDAVGLMGGNCRMFAGRNNCGEASRHDIGEQATDAGCVTVSAVDAAELPFADILKIDTEGCEMEILNRLNEAGRLTGFIGIMAEYHSEKDRRAIDALLSPAFFLCGSRADRPNRGVVRYLNRSIEPQVDTTK